MKGQEGGPIMLKRIRLLVFALIMGALAVAAFGVPNAVYACDGQAPGGSHCPIT